jgi:quinol monooxygenase YgiN
MHRLARLLFAVLALSSVGSPLPVVRAQGPAPGEASHYAVAYVGVAPASRTPAIAAFAQYRSASRSQAGFVRADLFEQIDRPGQLVVIETWRDAAAYAARSGGAALAQFHEALQPLRITGYDERPYKNFATAPSQAGGGDAVHVVSHVDTIGGAQGGGPDMVRKQAEASRRESGNLRFDVLQHTMRANHFTVVESWASRRAFETHAAAAHTKQYREAMQPVTGSPVDERTYRLVE